VRAGPLAGVDDAVARILEAAAYLRSNAPASPLGFLAVRAVRMGLLTAEDGADPFARLKPPASATRELLVQLQEEGRWGELLEQAEQVLGREEGRGWLDADFFADLALRSGDEDRTAVLAVTRSLLRTLLNQFPHWAETTFQRDRTAAAAAETRQWLRDEIVSAAGAEPVEPAPVAPAPSPGWSEPPVESADPDQGGDRPALERARELAERGDVEPAIELLRAALPVAASGRERFLIKLHLAEQFLARGRYELTLVIAEDLARQVDALRLEQWEDNRLLARVWAALYQGLHRAGAADGAVAPDRLKDAFSRLLLLDINRALHMDRGDR
jgi:hypothetical protein